MTNAHQLSFLKKIFWNSLHKLSVAMVQQMASAALQGYTSVYTCPIMQVQACSYLPRLLCFLSLPNLLYLATQFTVPTQFAIPTQFTVPTGLILTCMAIVFYTCFRVLDYAWLQLPSVLSSMHVHYISLPCLPLSIMPTWYGCVVAQSACTSSLQHIYTLSLLCLPSLLCLLVMLWL